MICQNMFPGNGLFELINTELGVDTYYTCIQMITYKGGHTKEDVHGQRVQIMKE